MPTPEIIPMHERRPNWIEAKVDETFAAIDDQLRGYAFFGDESSYTFYPLEYTLGYDDTLITWRYLAKMEVDRGRKLRVLDIGAAAAAFALNCQHDGHDAMALSAHDFQSEGNKTARQLAKGSYVVGDANRIGDITELSETGGFDFIASQRTFCWLVDPAGTLEQALGLLSPNGVLAVGSLKITHGTAFFKPGAPINTEGIKEYLRASGYSVMGGNVSWSGDLSAFCLTDMVIQAPADTPPQLAFPLDYEKQDDLMRYVKLNPVTQ